MDRHARFVAHVIVTEPRVADLLAPPDAPAPSPCLRPVAGLPADAPEKRCVRFAGHAGDCGPVPDMLWPLVERARDRIAEVLAAEASGASCDRPNADGVPCDRRAGHAGLCGALTADGIACWTAAAPEGA